MADVGAVVNLLPLMLCPIHWEMTVYYNIMFLDFTDSRMDTRDYENIVIDLESAKIINEAIAVLTTATASEKRISASSSGCKGSLSLSRATISRLL